MQLQNVGQLGTGYAFQSKCNSSWKKCDPWCQCGLKTPMLKCGNWNAGETLEITGIDKLCEKVII